MQEAKYSLKYYKGYTGKSAAEDDALNEELQRLNLTVNERKAEAKLRASDICKLI